MRLVPYTPERARDLVVMWRASFEKALGLVDPHPLADQIRFLEEKVVPANRVVLALEDASPAILGFLAATPERINQLYVHVAHQRCGLGSALLARARAESSGSLRLFTFARNLGAQRFYERHGFRLIAHGFEKEWQLDDLEYEWRAGPHLGY